MSRKHSRPSSVSLDNINVGIFADEFDASTTENPPKRKRGNGSHSILLKQVQERKDLLFLEYQDIFRKKKEEDKAWQWLGGLGIPCHNTPIPVMPHTKAHLHKGILTTADPLKDISFETVYHAHDVTQYIVSRYCDWKISKKLPDITIDKALNVFLTYRNAAWKTTLDESTPCPHYEERPTRHDPEKAIERYILRVLRSAAVIFKDPKLRIPVEWEKIPAPRILTLPSIYIKMLTDMETNDGRVPEEDEEGPFSREPSRPLDEIEGSALMDLLKSSTGNDDPVSVSEKEKLELFQKPFPIDGTVTRETAYENAQQARKMGATVAHKLNADAYQGAVQFVDAGKIPQLDDSGLGSVLFNDEPTILAHQTANIALKWVNQTGSPPSATETGDEKDVGGLLNKLVISGEIRVSDNGTFSLPGCLQMAGMRPQPDLFSQAGKVASCPRLATVSPVIFAGECKTKKGLTCHTLAQLACALNGTLVLLVLMYLDMRTSTEDPLPDWLFVYGIIYTGSGVIIRAHYPTYRYAGEESDMGTDGEYEPRPLKVGRKGKKVDRNENNQKGIGPSKGEIPKPQDDVPTLIMQRQLAVNHDLPRWIFRSVEVTRRYSRSFESPESNERLQLLATLLIVRSHSFLLLEKFKAGLQSAHLARLSSNFFPF